MKKLRLRESRGPSTTFVRALANRANKTVENSIKVERIKPISTGGNVKAFVTVRIDDIVINDVRLIQQPGQQAWITGPQREYQDGQGNRKFVSLVQFSDSLKRAVQRVVLEAVAGQK